MYNSHPSAVDLQWKLFFKIAELIFELVVPNTIDS